MGTGTCRKTRFLRCSILFDIFGIVILRYSLDIHVGLLQYIAVSTPTCKTKKIWSIKTVPHALVLGLKKGIKFFICSEVLEVDCAYYFFLIHVVLSMAIRESFLYNPIHYLMMHTVLKTETKA